MAYQYLHTYHEEFVEKGMFGNEEIIDYFGEITKIKQNGGTNGLPEVHRYDRTNRNDP